MISSVQLLKAIKEKQNLGIKSLAVLLDPDKIEADALSNWIMKIPQETDYILVGGSSVEDAKTGQIVEALKAISALPIILFPGDVNQITPHADALLFLSLMSGENPEYLIRQQVKSVNYLKHTDLEIIPTGYILIDGGQTCTTEKITNTKAIPQNQIEKIVDIALAAQYSGKQLIYLEAGSGAKYPVHPDIIKKVSNSVNIPVITGGGIRTLQQRQAAYDAGADMVVMGTAFED
jgi:putative glycerol-1-phosphate prenyltransferase